jgi:carbon-monoxide dehydrogenase medium subunit
VPLPKFEYKSPKSVEEASKLLKEHGGKAKVLAGGTDLLVKMKERAITPEYVINVKGIAGLDGISDGGGIKIGALATLETVLKSKEVKGSCPILVETIEKMATVQVRNMATVGGNLCNAAPSADLAPPLIVLGAKAKLVNGGEEREVLVEELFTGPGETVMKEGELMVEVEVPKPEGKTGGAYLKGSRTAVDLAQVGVAVMVKAGGGGEVEEVKIALGAVAPTPIRAKKAEGILKGKKADGGLIEEAAKAASEEAKPISDVRSSAYYRTEMVRVLTKRAVTLALERAK